MVLRFSDLFPGLFVLLFAVTPAGAGLIGLDLGTPDATSSNIYLDYLANGAGNGTLTSNIGWTLSIKYSSTNIVDLDSGDYQISAVLNHSDPLNPTPVSGSLSITGGVDPNAPQLLFGSIHLVRFGYSGNILEFDFADVTGSLAVSGQDVGVILTAQQVPDFSADFHDNQLLPGGYADNFSIPEPATLLFFGCAGVGLLARRVRRRQMGVNHTPAPPICLCGSRAMTTSCAGSVTPAARS